MNHQLAVAQARQLAAARSASMAHLQRLQRMAPELAAIEHARNERLRKAPFMRIKSIAAFTLASVVVGIAAGWGLGADSGNRDPLQALKAYLHRITAPAPSPALPPAPTPTPTPAEPPSNPQPAPVEADAAPEQPVASASAATTATVKPPALPVKAVPKVTPVPRQASAPADPLAELEEAARQAAKGMPAAVPNRGAASPQPPQQGGVFVEIPSRGPAVPTAATQGSNAGQDTMGRRDTVPVPKAPAYKVLHVMDDTVLIQEGNSVRAVRKGDLLPDGRRVGASQAHQ